MVGQQLSEMRSWAWAASAAIGTSHLRTGDELEDVVFAFELKTPLAKSVFCGIVSDGAGSAKYGGKGAALVCRTISLEMRKYFRNNDFLPNREIVESWIDLLRDRIFLAAQKRSCTPRDFAATLVAVASFGEQSLVFHVGDGAVALKSASQNFWFVPSWPSNGEFASTTYFVTDEILDNLLFHVITDPISSLVLFSDGIERLALDFSAQTPFAPFCDAMCSPLVNSSEVGKNRVLSKMLSEYLNSEKVNSRTDDDKSLIIAVAK